MAGLARELLSDNGGATRAGAGLRSFPRAIALIHARFSKRLLMGPHSRTNRNRAAARRRLAESYFPLRGARFTRSLGADACHTFNFLPPARTVKVDEFCLTFVTKPHLERSPEAYPIKRSSRDPRVG